MDADIGNLGRLQREVLEWFMPGTRSPIVDIKAARGPGPKTPADSAAFSRAVRLLERRGLIRRARLEVIDPGEEDTRATYLALTEQGQAVAAIVASAAGAARNGDPQPRSPSPIAAVDDVRKQEPVSPPLARVDAAGRPTSLAATVGSVNGRLDALPVERTALPSPSPVIRPVNVQPSAPSPSTTSGPTTAAGLVSPPAPTSGSQQSSSWLRCEVCGARFEAPSRPVFGTAALCEDCQRPVR